MGKIEDELAEDRRQIEILGAAVDWKDKANEAMIHNLETVRSDLAETKRQLEFWRNKAETRRCEVLEAWAELYEAKRQIREMSRQKNSEGDADGKQQ